MTLKIPNAPRLNAALGLTEPSALPNIKEGFTNGFVLELQSLQSGAPKTFLTHVMPLNPVRYTLQEPNQTTLTPTEADTVIEESQGIIVREIILEGTYGLQNRTPRGFSEHQGAGSGNQHFLHLRNFFREYSRKKQNPEEAATTRMVFHSMREDDHFVVVPRAFEQPRDAMRNRTHYEYRITLAAIGLADNIATVPDPDSFSFTDAFNDINDHVNEARALFVEINQSLGVLERKIANVTAVMINVRGLLNQMFNALEGSADITINSPFQLASDITTQASLIADRAGQVEENFKDKPGFDAVDRNLEKLESSLNHMLMYPGNFQAQDPQQATERAYRGETALTEDDLENNTGGASAGSRARAQRGAERNAGADFGQRRGLLRVPVEATTTLDSLANQFNVTREAIIITNDLRAPYFTPGGGSGTLKPGDFALIPIPNAAQAGTDTFTQPGGVYLTQDEALYGVDIALDRDLLDAGLLDLTVDTTRGSLDAELSRGVENVVQGVHISFSTEKSSTQFIPELGVSRAVGSKGTLEAALLASLNFREAVLSDPRIVGILESTIVLDGDVLTQEITPQIRGQRDGLSGSLPFGTPQGG